jgi:histidyl-tRNA synthetase
MPTYASLPGFRDFYPPELSIRTHIMHVWRTVARRFGYDEYDGPPLEPLELYTEKSGEEIVRQLYNFEDKGGRQVTLRPEMTPTLARMVAARAGALRKPVRWFSIPQLFRYERMQRGRLREHFQWNVDIIGEADVSADAEVLAVAIDALRAFGLGADDIVARFNDRRLLERLLLAAGVSADALGVTYNAVDKLGREPADRVRARLVDGAGLAERTAAAVLAIFDHAGLDDLGASYAHVPGVAEELERLHAFAQQLEDLGLGDFVRYDAGIVRGLAYYTGVVFEIFDRKGEFRAICGGGRYDRLLQQVGAADLPAAGFGMGDVVIAELLADRGLLPDTRPAIDYYIVVVGEAERPLQRRLAGVLRSRGHAVTYALRPGGVGKQFKEADARGARHVIVLGPAEVAAGIAVVREMASGEEQRMPLERLLAPTDEEEARH